MTSEERDVEVLLALFRWDDTLENRYHALVQLRRARGEDPPSWDDYRAGVRR